MGMKGHRPRGGEVDAPRSGTLGDIIDRRPLEPWTEGDNIPWDDPEFSRRMLHEHLTDAHDLASRRPSIIDTHVDRIHSNVLRGEPSVVLDLACGPGLYLNRLARLGHRGVGIDFSPASIEYARGIADLEDLPVEHTQQDVRTAPFGAGFDLVMMLYGQLNVFRRTEASEIVKRAAAALAPGGRLLLETQTTARRLSHPQPTQHAPMSTVGSDELGRERLVVDSHATVATHGVESGPFCA